MGDYSPKVCRSGRVVDIVFYIFEIDIIWFGTLKMWLLLFKISKHTRSDLWTAQHKMTGLTESCSSDPLCTSLNFFWHLVAQFAFLV
jgi:hypothetical protein